MTTTMRANTTGSTILSVCQSTSTWQLVRQMSPRPECLASGLAQVPHRFEVVAVEQKRTIEFSNLQLEGRIDRMDKVAGGHVLIDYKTGRQVSANDW